MIRTRIRWLSRTCTFTAGTALSVSANELTSISSGSKVPLSLIIVMSALGAALSLFLLAHNFDEVEAAIAGFAQGDELLAKDRWRIHRLSKPVWVPAVIGIAFTIVWVGAITWKVRQLTTCN
jgi:cytochrome c biogenesis protein CcdA